MFMWETRIVTPHAGVWIEIESDANNGHAELVTPHAGVWIEIIFRMNLIITLEVPPHAGVWIEIVFICVKQPEDKGHSPRGSVD